MTTGEFNQALKDANAAYMIAVLSHDWPRAELITATKRATIRAFKTAPGYVPRAY